MTREECVVEAAIRWKKSDLISDMMWRPGRIAIVTDDAIGVIFEGNQCITRIPFESAEGWPTVADYEVIGG